MQWPQERRDALSGLGVILLHSVEVASVECVGQHIGVDGSGHTDNRINMILRICSVSKGRCRS